MPRSKETGKVNKRSFAPARTPDEQEQQMVTLAMDLAEEQLRNGTASSQVITHFLKIGSLKEQKELKLLENQNKLLEAKTESLESAKRVEELYTKAIDAMRRYSGERSEKVDEDEDDY